MPTFDPNTPRLDRKVREQAITVPAIFAEGTVLSADTAKWANNALASQIVNAIGGEINEWLKANPKAKGPQDYPNLQARVDEVFAARQLGVNARKGTGTSGGSDPIDRLIRTFAAEDAKARIVKAGYKVKDFMATKTQDGKSTKYADFVAHVLSTKEAEFRAQAEAIIASQSADAEDDTAFLAA